MATRAHRGPDRVRAARLLRLAAFEQTLDEYARRRRRFGARAAGVFGVHGGVLDRLDAVFFTAIVGYYASVALGYG